MIAKEGRSSAVGLYVTCFYVGGSVGAFLPGLTWATAGWPGGRRDADRHADHHGLHRGICLVARAEPASEAKSTFANADDLL